jgi:hypothetical protein
MRVKLIARIMAEGVRDIFALLHATIRKHGQQRQTVRLRNAWVDVDPSGWKRRDDMTINVGLGAGGRAQQFAQTMALANLQKEMLAGGKVNLVGDLQLYNTAAELTRIMGHKNPDKFFNDPGAINPQTGQPLHPPPPPSPDPEWLAAQAKASSEQQRDQAAAVRLQVRTQAEIELARIKAELEVRMALLDAHLKAAGIQQKMRHAETQHELDAAGSVLDMMATAQANEAKAHSIDELQGRSHDG